MDLGETVEGHHCLGGPVFDRDGRPVASLWITALTPRLGQSEGQRLAPDVIRACEMLTSLLAGKPPRDLAELLSRATPSPDRPGD